MIRVRAKQADDQPWIEGLLQERCSGTAPLCWGLPAEKGVRRLFVTQPMADY
jgi:hypothetical protein